MKDYLNFQLKGKQVLPLWILFYVIFIVPYGLFIFKIQSLAKQHDLEASKQVLKMLPMFIPVILAVMIWSLYFMKKIIEGIAFRESQVKCDYKLGKYLGVIFLGLFLSIITLGIYSPWFIRNIYRYYMNNSSYRDKNFSFLGEGSNLFVIILVSVIIPMIVIFVIAIFVGILHRGNIDNQSVSFAIIREIIIIIILTPYMYLIYKWCVDVKYGDYHVTWHTQFFPSVGKILLEIILSIITVGIYLPLAYLRLYTYFAGKTQSNSVDNQVIQFGYDIDQLKDFLFVWGQLLLTLITLGIYYPWAICKVGQRVLGKTYIEKITK